MVTADEYFRKQKTPQKEICLALRKIILGEYPKIGEEMLWGVPAYGGGMFYIAALKDSVNMGFAVKGLPKTDLKLFEGTGKLMGHLKFRSMGEIGRERITGLMRLVFEKAECGGDGKK
jgi:hypothetical protein